MAYRYDIDLEFLSKIKSEDLDNLVRLLTHDKDGDTRWTESLTQSNEYKRHHPDHHQYWELIAEEIQCFGANTFATLCRGGKGVLYKEILMDVCDKMKVKYNKEASSGEIEINLLSKILENALEKMSPEEIKELAASLEIDNANISSMAGCGSIAAFQAIFRAGGFKSYQLTLIIVNTVLKAMIGRGLTLAGNAALMRGAALLAGPIGWAVTGIWSAFDIGSPAYRVTIPAVIQISALRQMHLCS